MYVYRFFKVLNEQENERAAMLSSLDSDTNPRDFDTEVNAPTDINNPNSAVSKALSEREAAMVSQVREWVANMEEFLENLNGTENSIQTALANAEAKINPRASMPAIEVDGFANVAKCSVTAVKASPLARRGVMS